VSGVSDGMGGILAAGRGDVIQLLVDEGACLYPCGGRTGIVGILAGAGRRL
jgi:hypothetical protein